MTQVTNFSPNPLVLPGNTEAIPAGHSAEVANWDEIKDHSLVKKFLSGDKPMIGVGAKAAKQAEVAASDEAPAAAPAPAGRGGSR